MRPRYALIRIIQRYNKLMSDNAGFFRPFLEQYTAMVSCPDPLLLEAFRLGQLTAADADPLQQHLVNCQVCQQSLSALTRTEGLPLPEIAASAPPFSASASLAEPLMTQPELQPGQIWSTRASLDLSAAGLAPANTQAVEAGFLRLFVVTALGALHLGRFREVTLCPLSEWRELATERDLILAPEDNPFEESIMLETWHQRPALALHLEQYHGTLSPAAWQALQTHLNAEAGETEAPRSGQRGGRLISDQGPHAAFQEAERAQSAYLQMPLQALKQLRKQAERCFLGVSPQGLQPPAAPAAAASFAPFQWKPPSPRLAAATATPTEAEHKRYVHQLRLSEQLRLDLWLDGSQLAFYAYTHEHQAVAGLEIFVPTRTAGCDRLVTDTLGTAFIGTEHLPPQLVLLEVELPSQQLKTWVPVFYSATEEN